MVEVRALKRVSLRRVWPDEARDFTPWLADNLSLLGSKLNLVLEREGVEVVLPGAGQVDILAKQAETGARVVIENQLGLSDDSHCLRLLGYAANAEANILVWVARDFRRYHRSILSWLNESDSIAAYAVAVRAYQVGDNLAVDFRLVVEPQEGTASGPRRETASSYYAEFYRPVVESLRRSGLKPMGRGGYRGKYRSFQTGYPDVHYSSGFSPGGRATASLGFTGANKQQIFDTFSRHRDEIDDKLEGRIRWHKGGKGSAWIQLKAEQAIDDPSSIPEEVGQWITENLLTLKNVLQPYLKEAMAEIDTSTDDVAENE